MKTTAKYPLITMAVVAAISTSCHHKSENTAAREAMPVEVSTVTTDSVTLYKEYPGGLYADRIVDVVARVNGTIETMNYNPGDYVRQGQILFTIDPTTYRNAVDEAAAALQQARSENEYAEQHYTAVANALESNAVSKMEVAQALSSRDQSRAAIKTAEARLSTARRQLTYCTVTAPCNGHVSINLYSRGAYVSGEGAPVRLATVYDDATVLARFSIEDASFQRMFLNPNNREKINYSSIPLIFSEKLPHDYTADLYYMAPDVNSSTGTIELEGTVVNKYNELKSGMYITIRLPYKMEPEAMLVRDASIGTDQLGKYVYTVNDSNIVRYTPIEVGDLVADTLRVVNKGLEPGERYVTSALLKVRDGMTVKPYSSTDKK